MGLNVTVVVATYGDTAWETLALSRAVPSAQHLEVPVVSVHGDALHEARNAGLMQVATEHVCFLDADDELTPGFFDQIAAVDADLRAPAVQYVVNGARHTARMPRVAGHQHACTAECLREGNWLVVGTVAPAELVREVGGWRDFEWSEDWDLWLRCWKTGATIAAAPRAVYRAHVRRDSRNRAPEHAVKMRVHHEILAANGLAA